MGKYGNSILFIGLVALMNSQVFAREDTKTCINDPKIQTLREEQLKTAYEEDQSDRIEIEAHLDTPASVNKIFLMAENDLKHRKIVAEIFAEGCLKTAADYARAAMIFQHGTVPEHFYQTFLWAKKAVELGDESQKQIMGLGLDRYLMFQNQKQLFGSQARKVRAEDLCWCLWPMEESFDEALSKKYRGRNKAEALEWVKEINGKNSCPVAECKVEVKETPKGSLPGFW